MIARSVIDDWFANNRKRGLSFDGDLVWGYFFVDPARPILQKFSAVLAAGGYHIVDIMNPQKQGGVRFLHVERVEKHDEQSLYERCQELSALAANHRVKFDGFDVGRLDGSPLY